MFGDGLLCTYLRFSKVETLLRIRGNHLSNTTCLAHVFFESVEVCINLNEPY